MCFKSVKLRFRGGVDLCCVISSFFWEFSGASVMYSSPMTSASSTLSCGPPWLVRMGSHPSCLASE